MKYSLSLQFRFLHISDKLFIFANSRNFLCFLSNLVRSFLKLRSVSVHSEFSFFTIYFNSFDLLGWNFSLYNSHKILGQVSIDNIRKHKRKLKTLIKNSLESNFFVVLSSINNLVSDWVNIYGCADFFFDVESNLDIYLFKLLWNWAKRRHPRRPNTWIYLKYWRYFDVEKRWNFFFIDFTVGRCLFLSLHTNSSTRNIYRIPSSMNVFDITFFSKLGLAWMKKLSTFLSGFYLILWKKQSGKCFICNKLFLRVGFNEVKIFSLKKNQSFVSDFFLVHRSCFFYLKFYYFSYNFYDES